ncbi:MAG: Mov34/MPN/PAD-1 family protein, partial [Myxococcales bacterium]|nr:Mov34/MPN/PAD-1 family protein [Myxococcales bacterium]
FHGRSDLSVELGGVMLGHHGRDALGEYVVVETYVPALRAKGRAATLTFDHETWREINAIKDESFPDLQVIGWYHTHPGYGIFLSGFDRFIDDNWFKTGHHIAAVFDPTLKMPEALGVFIWAGDGSGRLRSGFASCEPLGERQ